MAAARRANLLIFRIGSLGDTIVALPCFHAIARAFPGHHRVLLTNVIPAVRASSVEAVLAGTGLIHETLYFPIGRGQLDYSLSLQRKLRQLKVNTLVYLTPRPRALPVYRDLLFFWASGLRTIIGAPVRARLRQCQLDELTGQREHEAARLARTLRPTIAVDLSAPNWDLRLSVAEHAVADKHLAGLTGRASLVALSPGARVQAKDWGEDRWAALLRVLARRLPELSLVFVGAPDERQVTDRLAHFWSGPKVNLCGELTPRESAAVLRRCDLLVCHDSGPMHLAASQGTRCVALFGNFNRPREWFPFGHDHRVIYEPRGVRSIGVEQVAEAVEAAVDELQHGPAATRRSAGVASL
jgi:ADP-heptose:LPS heptosyltransferase